MLAVDRQARSGQCPRAEREDVGALTAIGEPIAVAAELLAPRQELMGGKDRLRPAEMGVAGDNQVGLALGKAEEGALERGEAGIDPVDRPAAIEAQIGGHLIVAAAGRVEPAAGVAQPRRQGRLDMEVDVLLRDRVGEGAGVDLRPDLFEPRPDRLCLRRRDDPAGREHRRVGDRAVDVVIGQALVERHALREGLDAGVGRLLEHASPGFWFSCGGGSGGIVRGAGVGHGGVLSRGRWRSGRVGTGKVCTVVGAGTLPG